MGDCVVDIVRLADALSTLDVRVGERLPDCDPDTGNDGVGVGELPRDNERVGEGEFDGVDDLVGEGC